MGDPEFDRPPGVTDRGLAYVVGAVAFAAGCGLFAWLAYLDPKDTLTCLGVFGGVLLALVILAIIIFTTN